MTDDEAIQLLGKGRHERKNENSTDKKRLIKRAIKSCRGLPLAISVIRGLDLQSDDSWRNVITTITTKDSETIELLDDYDFNIFATFELSVNQLNQDDQNLFRSLGVFKAVKIPVESIASLWGLWDITKDNVTPKLKKLHRQSLLNFDISHRLVSVIVYL